MLAETGRNEPCPCGSGRKFKRCCFGRGADTGGSHALVDRAIATDDWDDVHAALNPAIALFEQDEPLGHVRFRDDRVGLRVEETHRSHVATPEWLRRCELELGHVLERIDIDDAERRGLQLATYLLRRFGAMSPVVDEVLRIQVEERVTRARRVATAASQHGLRADALDDWAGLPAWIEQAEPCVLTFADWFALWFATGSEEREWLWVHGIASRVCDACCDVAEAYCEDRQRWLQLASLALWAHAPELTVYLSRHTLPGAMNDAETRAAAAIFAGKDEGLAMVAREVIAATHERGDFAGAAMFRETLQRKKAALARTAGSS